ncbi:MAG: DUF6463 family protein [Gemmatimonadales bacterium]
MTGLAWLALGDVAGWCVRETGRLPAHLGGWLLATSVPMIVLLPASGGWLIVALGAFALRAARDEHARAAPNPPLIGARK